MEKYNQKNVIWYHPVWYPSNTNSSTGDADTGRCYDDLPNFRRDDKEERKKKHLPDVLFEI